MTARIALCAALALASALSACLTLDELSVGRTEVARVAARADSAVGSLRELQLRMGTNKEPDCDRPNECRFTSTGGITTLMNCPQVFKRDGTLAESFCKNTSTATWMCLTCGKSWATSE